MKLDAFFASQHVPLTSLDLKSYRNCCTMFMTARLPGEAVERRRLTPAHDYNSSITVSIRENVTVRHTAGLESWQEDDTHLMLLERFRKTASGRN